MVSRGFYDDFWVSSGQWSQSQLSATNIWFWSWFHSTDGIPTVWPIMVVCDAVNSSLSPSLTSVSLWALCGGFRWGYGIRPTRQNHAHRPKKAWSVVIFTWQLALTHACCKAYWGGARAYADLTGFRLRMYFLNRNAGSEGVAGEGGGRVTLER